MRGSRAGSIWLGGWLLRTNIGVSGSTLVCAAGGFADFGCE